LEKEVIFKDDLIKIFGKRPFDVENPKSEEEPTENNKEEIKEENKN